MGTVAAGSDLQEMRFALQIPYSENGGVFEESTVHYSFNYFVCECVKRF